MDLTEYCLLTHFESLPDEKKPSWALGYQLGDTFMHHSGCTDIVVAPAGHVLRISGKKYNNPRIADEWVVELKLKYLILNCWGEYYRWTNGWFAPFGPIKYLGQDISRGIEARERAIERIPDLRTFCQEGSRSE